MTGFDNSIIQTVLTIILLVGMAVLLLSINHFLHNDDSLPQSDTDQLKRELERDADVITRRNIFHKFLARTISSRKK